MEPLEGLDTSLDESDNKAEDGDKDSLSDVGKQKRGKSTENAKIEKMVKEILSRNNEYNRDSKEVHMKRLMEGWNGQMANRITTMMTNNKRKADVADPLLEEKVLICVRRWGSSLTHRSYTPPAVHTGMKIWGVKGGSPPFLFG